VCFPRANLEVEIVPTVARRGTGFLCQSLEWLQSPDYAAREKAGTKAFECVHRGKLTRIVVSYNIHFAVLRYNHFGGGCK
jgi:hypothetical protein